MEDRLASEPSVIQVILTHDVDWSPKGPGIDHILARKDRFDQAVIARVVEEGYNPYFNIPDLMAIEDSYGVRSTFFFRSEYEHGILVDAYEDSLKALVEGGWEIGLHVNDASSVDAITAEKEAVERIAKVRLDGSRVHYLRIDLAHLSLLEDAGFIYDSSITFCKESISGRNAGYIEVGGLVVFPITLMDTYVFTYMRVPETRIVELIDRALQLSSDKGFVTILWHDNSLKMRGGRMYPAILEFLKSRDNVRMVRGIDAYKAIVRRGR
jgi:peptidoglycan/xylan/chitin deacetylase (PgdA/CDA1 family)